MKNDFNKFLLRQNARRKMEFGVNFRCKPWGPGISTAGVYIHIGGNIETAKRLHRETLEVLKLVLQEITPEKKDV